MMVDASFAFELPKVSAGWVEVYDVETGRTRMMSRRELSRQSERVSAWQDEVARQAKDNDLDVIRLAIDQVKFDVALVEWVAERRLRRRRSNELVESCQLQVSADSCSRLLLIGTVLLPKPQAPSPTLRQARRADRDRHGGGRADHLLVAHLDERGPDRRAVRPDADLRGGRDRGDQGRRRLLEARAHRGAAAAVRGARRHAPRRPGDARQAVLSVRLPAAPDRRRRVRRRRRVPPLEITYRVESKVAGGEAVQGRDQTLLAAARVDPADLARARRHHATFAKRRRRCLPGSRTASRAPTCCGRSPACCSRWPAWSCC